MLSLIDRFLLVSVLKSFYEKQSTKAIQANQFHSKVQSTAQMPITLKQNVSECKERTVSLDLGWVLWSPQEMQQSLEGLRK